MKEHASIDFAFFETLHIFYINNKLKIRSNYKQITKKFLDYNDSDKNPNAFLRRPQFEALEMYVFIKEFLDNMQMYEIYDKWNKREAQFQNEKYYENKDGQQSLYEQLTQKQSSTFFEQLRANAMGYPNYIYALTMGLGKTILMATCIFYEFLLASKYSDDERYCHNVLVFAPDKTVLESLREIVTFDKALVIPKEYIDILDSNIKFHFLNDAGITLNTIDNSMYNIIISNTQKIILKRQHKEKTSVDKLFQIGTGEDVIDNVLSKINDAVEITNDLELSSNQRFEKLKRLRQIGIYVDEAHHMFGSNLEKSLYSNSSDTSLRTTINELANALERQGSKIVACYNYTGTPYVNNVILPEVIYEYGLRKAIVNNYLKDVEVKGYENVKSNDFLKMAISDFWFKYGNSSYDGLTPKLAIFGADIDEVKKEIVPVVEEILLQLGISLDKILINVGDEKITKDIDIKDFNNLDIKGTEGNKKQFIILVNKGREGWNCKSLFGVALFRSPKSKIFVLQATMRCLRKLTAVQQRATVYLSNDNLVILDNELQKNFKVGISDLKNVEKKEKKIREVRVNKPLRYVKVNHLIHRYSLIEKGYQKPLNFELQSLDLERYKAIVKTKIGLGNSLTLKETAVDYMIEKNTFSKITLVAEIARYLNLKCLLVSKILKESVDGIDLILEYVNLYNDIVYDMIIPKIFNELYEVKVSREAKHEDVVLLKEPENAGYYEFISKDELTVDENTEDTIVRVNKNKSFHADTYCFDSLPEKELFLQYLQSDKVKEIYFTGMFTGNQSDFYVSYIDPETQQLRKYYPDFIAKMEDGSYEIIEVKGDNALEDEIVKVKERAAQEVAEESNMRYQIIPSSKIMNGKII